jgi:uncharacterized YccA/Bax inhibitor family protein
MKGVIYMFRTGNPALRSKAFNNISSSAELGKMTIQGTVNKTIIMFFILLLSASWCWSKFIQFGPQAVGKWIILGAIAGFVLGLITIFKKEWAPYTAILYALAQGFFIGGISSIFEYQYPGIVIQAVALTFGTLFCLLFLYKARLIKVTENFKLGIASAMGGIMIFYLVGFVLRLFGIQFTAVYGSSLVSIAFSLFIVAIAALNLVLDFDFIEKGSQLGAPKYMEWYGAFGLMLTLIWLYMEILRLLVKLRQRR